jgi:hypothetical protein
MYLTGRAVPVLIDFPALVHALVHALAFALAVAPVLVHALGVAVALVFASADMCALRVVRAWAAALVPLRRVCHAVFLALAVEPLVVEPLVVEPLVVEPLVVDPLVVEPLVVDSLVVAYVPASVPANLQPGSHCLKPACAD